MIALGGPKLKRLACGLEGGGSAVSMIALGGPKLKLVLDGVIPAHRFSFNDSTGWA